MTESDAKELVAERAPDWEMPEEWWSIEAGDMTMHVSEAVIASLTNVTYEKDLFDFWVFNDLYGAEVHLDIDSIQAFFHSTRLSRAKWIVGLPERNYKADEKPDWDQKD